MRYDVHCILHYSDEQTITVDADDPKHALEVAKQVAFDRYYSNMVYLDYVDYRSEPIERPYTESELARIENDRLRRAGQLELWNVQS